MSSMLNGGDYQLGADIIQMMTMRVSKSLVFPVQKLSGLGYMTANDEKEAARVIYLAATQAIHRKFLKYLANHRFHVE